MRLFAAIMPPRGALDEVISTVRSVNDPLEDPAPRGFRLRRSSRPHGAHAAGRAPVGTRPAPAASPTTHELDAHEMEHLYIPITGFGNVTLGDSVKLAAALRTAVTGWRRCELAFAGGTALEFPGDQSVWVKLEGDLDALSSIGRGVPQAVQRVGYFVDRRQFRTWMSVGTITDTTTAPYLERLVAALDDLHGEPWVADAVSLLKWLPDSDGPARYEEMERMPLS